MSKKTTPKEASINGMYPLHKHAKCLISLLKNGKTQPFALLDDLSNLFCQQPRRVQRRMANDLFLLLIYGSVDEYKFADTGDESLDDVLNDMFGEIIFHLCGVHYFTEDCGMPSKRALETYLFISNNYPYKSIRYER